MTSPDRSTRGNGPARRYPPLVSAALSLVLALFVLPSALNVPQSNPTQTLEFAPIPPDDDEPPPPEQANLESLSLGSSSTAPAGDSPGAAGPGLPPPPVTPPGAGVRPVTKRCVGNPPRQTEDPSAPPCVAHFEGDNGGATAEGVSPDEVRLVVYLDPATRTDGSQTGDPGAFYDLAEPMPVEAGTDHRVLRMVQDYFNDRFQTYGRFVHLWIQIGSVEKDDATPESRRADASAALSEVRPFAVLNTVGTFKNEYTRTLAQSGVVTFLGVSPGESSGIGLTAATFQQYPGLIWGLAPSIEKRADNFVSAACMQVVGRPVTFGDEANRGKERVLGIFRSAGGVYPEIDAWGERIQAGMQDCGAEFAAEGRVTSQCNVCASSDGGPEQRAFADIAEFQQAGVTTVIWAAGSSSNQTDAAAGIRYHPEWVIAGDGNWADSTFHGQSRNQELWQHARTYTLHARNAAIRDRDCARAAYESDPAAEQEAVGLYYCGYYPYFVQLFTGIQVAGPRLTPQSMDQGFHAIPPVPSGDVSVPACFYDAADYTCIKDATEAWWDPSGTNTNNTVGCWRLYEGGRRYFAGTWPDRDVDAGRSPDDPCNLQGAHAVNT